MSEVSLEMYSEPRVNSYSEAIALGNLFMVEKLIEFEKDKARKEKKQNVYKEKKNLALKAFGRAQRVIDLKTGRQQLFKKFLK